MKEVELKILEVDVPALLVRIKHVGGNLVQPKTLYFEQFYKFPKGKKNFSSLRLRQEGRKTFLTMKFNAESSDMLSREEFEVRVSDFETTSSILQGIGLKPFRFREKYRTKYKVGTASLELDEYPGVPIYAEIEGQSRKEVLGCLRALGLEKVKTTVMTATEVIRFYGKNPDKLVFDKNKLSH